MQECKNIHNILYSCIFIIKTKNASVAELVDARDSKSRSLRGVRVRFSPEAH